MFQSMYVHVIMAPTFLSHGSSSNFTPGAASRPPVHNARRTNMFWCSASVFHVISPVNQHFLEKNAVCFLCSCDAFVARHHIQLFRCDMLWQAGYVVNSQRTACIPCSRGRFSDTQGAEVSSQQGLRMGLRMGICDDLCWLRPNMMDAGRRNRI